MYCLYICPLRQVNRKYVAHDEKSKFFTFCTEVAYGKPSNLVGLFIYFFLEIVFNPPQVTQIS